MYAIFEDGSRQYRVEEGQVVTVDLREDEVGSRVEFNNILLYVNGEEPQIGRPYLEGMRVVGEVVGNPSTKVVIQKYRRRKNYRRKRGHRQRYTAVRILHILLPGMEIPPPEEKPTTNVRHEVGQHHFEAPEEQTPSQAETSTPATSDSPEAPATQEPTSSSLESTPSSEAPTSPTSESAEAEPTSSSEASATAEKTEAETPATSESTEETATQKQPPDSEEKEPSASTESSAATETTEEPAKDSDASTSSTETSEETSTPGDDQPEEKKEDKS